MYVVHLSWRMPTTEHRHLIYHVLKKNLLFVATNGWDFDQIELKPSIINQSIIYGYK